jgi:WD40 repeat protein
MRPPDEMSTDELLLHNPPPSSPYVYLDPFSEEDEPFFFGRERETGDIIASLKTRRLTLLYGPSGVGKSSVLNAGVAHHLRRMAALRGPFLPAVPAAAGPALALDLAPGASPRFVPPSKPRFAVIVFKYWSGNPLRDLREAIFAELDVSPELRAGCPEGLTETIRTLTDSTTEPFGLLIILDQFEEFFVYHPLDGETGDGFAAEFTRAVTDPQLKANFLISIREDWMARLDRFKGRIPNLFESYLRVTHLNREAARAAIVEPVEAYNNLLRELDGDAARVVEIEDGFVDCVLDQLETLNDNIEDAITINAHGFQRTIRVADGHVQTPDLQVVMTRLWERMKEQGPRRVLGQHLLTEGNNTAREIINADLGQRLGKLSLQEQGAAAKLFPHLISTLDTKVSHTAQDIADLSDLNLNEVSPLLPRLTTLGILRQVPHSPGQQNLPRYEIAHDVLARPLQAWSVRVRSEIHTRNREKRHRDAVIRRGLAIIVCILLIAAAILLGSFVDARQNRRRAERAQAEAERQKAEAERERAQAQKTLAVIRKLDEDTPHSKAVLRGHSAAVTSAAFFQQGQVLTASADGTLRRWNIETKDVAAEWESEQGQLTALALDARHGRAVTGAENGTVKLWDVAEKSGKLLRDAIPAAITDVEFSPGGELVVVADNQGTIIVWEVGRDSFVQRLDGHKGTVTQLTFSRDGRFFASSSADGTARVVRVSDWRETVLQGHAGPVKGLAFSPDGRWVATASEDKTVRLWNAETGTWRPIGRHAAEVNTVEFAPDGKRLVTASDDATARVWTIDDPEPDVLSGSPSEVLRATFSPDGKLVATASKDNIARVWTPSAREPLVELRGHLSRVTDMTFSPDGTLVLTASEDATARLWSTPRPTGNLTIEELTIDAIPKHYVGQCPITIRFFVGITASNPGTVLYQFSQSGGSPLPVRSHTFSEPGTKYVDWFRRIKTSGEYWEDINIIEPQNVEPQRVRFRVRCTEADDPPPQPASEEEVDS